MSPMPYLTSDTELASVANAIRAKGGISSSLSFPDGFIGAINNISISRKCVSGTFTGSISGEAISISIPYTGSGYPIEITICPSTGTFKDGTSIYNLVQKSVVVAYSAIKVNMDTEPSYTSSDSSLEKNKMTFLVRYKNSDNDATALSASAGEAAIFTNYGASNSPGTVVRMSDATTMSVMIAGASYGFKEGIEYMYHILYSSEDEEIIPASGVSF